jgi:hypothetical protein
MNRNKLTMENLQSQNRVGGRGSSMTGHSMSRL